MKVTLLLLLSFLATTPKAEANTEACTAHLTAAPFNAPNEEAFNLCSLNPAFIHQCMEESSATYLTHDFEALTDICLERFQRNNDSFFFFPRLKSNGQEGGKKE